MASPLEVYLLTFNCARQPVSPPAFSPHFFNALPLDARLPDVVAISLQEIAPIAESFLGGSYLKNYYVLIEESFRAAAKGRGEEQYELLYTNNVGMTALMVFVSERIQDRVSWLETGLVGVGLWEMGNKGAVGARLGLSTSTDGEEEATLTFVAAHLAPFESNIQRRNEDWANIVRNLVFTRSPSSSGVLGKRKRGENGYGEEQTEPLLSEGSGSRGSGKGIYDGGPVFFLGDLNYRTSSLAPHPGDHRNYPQPTASPDDPNHIANWLKNDQLTIEREAGRVLHGFNEMPIKFPPTYKYSDTPKLAAESGDRGEEPERWLWATHRVPSWCDRILWWSPYGGIEAQHYVSLPVQPTSDHRPVALAATVALRPSSQSGDAPFPLNAGWEAKRAAARRREIMVGVGAWGLFTTEGRVCLLLPMVLALLGYLVFSGR